jgi:hypothetical protein
VSKRHTDMTDIREWLMVNRPDLEVKPRGAIKNSAIEAYREANPAGEDDDVSRETGDGEDRETSGEVTAPQETAPDPGRPRGWFRPKGSTPREPKARVTRRRVPVDGLLAMGWAALGRIAETPATLPVSRVMQLQAPAAGMILDDALRGSLVDKIAQPFARGAKRCEMVFAVAGPPLLVGAVCQRPELYDVVKPMLAEALKTWIIMSGPKIRKAKERERKLLEELDGDLESIEEMIDALFAPPDPPLITDAQPARQAA